MVNACPLVDDMTCPLCLRVFIVVLQELHCLLQCLPWLFCVFIKKHVYASETACWIVITISFIGCCFSKLHAHLYPYHNVWPKVVLCCFTRTSIITNNLIWQCTRWFLSVCKVSLINSVLFLTYVSWNWSKQQSRQREDEDCENELYCSPILVINSDLNTTLCTLLVTHVCSLNYVTEQTVVKGPKTIDLSIGVNVVSAMYDL